MPPATVLFMCQYVLNQNTKRLATCFTATSLPFDYFQRCGKAYFKMGKSIQELCADLTHTVIKIKYPSGNIGIDTSARCYTYSVGYKKSLTLALSSGKQ